MHGVAPLRKNPTYARTARHLRATAAVLVLVTTSLLSSIRHLQRSYAETGPRAVVDSITQYEHRFEELRKALPQRGHVCYIAGKQEDVHDFYLTQYALAPLVLQNNTECELVIGNFPNSPAAPITDLVPVRKFGGGVELLRRKEK